MKKTQFYAILGVFALLVPGLIGAQGFPGGASDPFAKVGGDPFANMAKAFDPASQDFTPEDEYYLGRAVAANILATYRPYTQNQELTKYLNRICQALVINSSRPEIYGGYRVMVLDTTEYNAFATPGGHIFVTRGLVEVTPSEEALAALIAHEISHIILRHGVSLIGDMSITNDAADMARRGAALSNSPGAQRALSMRNSVTGIIDTMMKNGFSRPQEFEADKAAVALLAATGYDPNGLVDMLKVLSRVQGSQKGGFNSTHPSPQERINNIGNPGAQYRVPDTKVSRTARFKTK